MWGRKLKFLRYLIFKWSLPISNNAKNSNNSNPRSVCDNIFLILFVLGVVLNVTKTQK